MKRAFRIVLPLSVMLAMVWSLGMPLHAADGVVLVEKTTSGGRTETHQIQVERTRMRTEMTGPNGQLQTVIFDAGKQVLWMVNTASKTYSEITKADVDQMGGQMSAAMAEMQAQLAAMPPAQRAQVEAMMRGRGMPGTAAPAPKTEYRKTGTDRVGTWTCDKYDSLQNNQKTGEICTVNPTAAGFTDADFEVTKQFAEFLSKLIPGGADAFRAGGAEAGFAGIPVRRITGSGPAQKTFEITGLTRENFADATFTPPAGFTKEPFMQGRGR